MLIPIRDAAHWHELRRRNVGASEVAALFGCQPDYAMSKWTLWQVKAGLMDPPAVTSDRPKWGLRLEQVIADAFCEDHGHGPAERCGYAQHAYHPHIKLGATPDFLLADGGVLETKNVDWLVRRRSWGDEPPMHILLQLQAQLACTGREWGIVAALVGGNELMHWRYDRRPKLIAEIERRVCEFWWSIDHGVEPDIDGSESTYAAVKARLPHAEDNSAIECDDIEFAELCVQVTDAKAEIKRLDAVRRECEAKLMHRIAGARRGYGMGWSATLIERAGTPEKTITEDMVGQTLPGRKGSVSLQVREMRT